MDLLLALPLAFWLLLSLLHARRGDGLRESALLGATWTGLLLVLLTELLGLAHALAAPALAASWALACVPPTILLLGGRPRLPPLRRPEVDRAAWLAGGSIAAIALLTALVAFVAPPNNWDSMAYHMPRVMHWAQNRTVAHYPTHIGLQLNMPPFAEFAILHTFLLSGGDRWANFVQWGAMLGSIAGVSLLARQLGGDRRAQLLAALFCATLPMGILQATGTQNDYVAGFWVVTFAHLALRLRAVRSWPLALAFGGSLGLAMLTKGTAWLFAFPFLAWHASGLLRDERARALPKLAAAALVAIALNAPHLARNLAAFGHPLAEERKLLASETHAPSAILSNVVRALAVELNSPSGRANKAVEDGVASLHRAVGLDVSDPRTTLYTKFELPAFYRLKIHEDVAGSPLHAVAILAAVLALLLAPRLRANRPLRGHAAATLGAFLFFCFYLKWQPWHARLLLPLLVLWAPAVALALSAAARPVAALAGGALVLGTIPFLLFNAARPLVAVAPLPKMGIESVLTTPRIEQYFNNFPSLRAAYLQSGRDFCAWTCRDVGITVGDNNGEYLLWMTMQAYCSPMPRIEHVEVPSNPGIPPLRPFAPCFATRL
jgi:hypothetical protein